MKKILSGALAVLAIATTLAVCVSANDGKSLNKSYTYSPVEGVDYTVYYDIGSILPYDDVRGRTKILLYADKGESEGYAIVKLTIKGEVKYPWRFAFLMRKGMLIPTGTSVPALIMQRRLSIMLMLSETHLSTANIPQLIRKLFV